MTNWIMNIFRENYEKFIIYSLLSKQSYDMQCIKCNRLLFFIKQLQDIEIANNVIYISAN